MISTAASQFSSTDQAVLQTESAVPVWPSSIWGPCSSSASPSHPASPSPAPPATPSPHLKYHLPSSLWEMMVHHPLRKFKGCHQYVYDIRRGKKGYTYCICTCTNICSNPYFQKIKTQKFITLLDNLLLHICFLLSLCLL